MVIPNHYWTGPLAALVAMAVVVLICRWVFSTSTPAQRRSAARPRGDYGLLVPVATTRTAEDADLLRGVLREAGIRCTVAEAPPSTQPGAWQLMVFRADAPRASELVRS